MQRLLFLEDVRLYNRDPRDGPKYWTKNGF